MHVICKVLKIQIKPLMLHPYFILKQMREKENFTSPPCITEKRYYFQYWKSNDFLCRPFSFAFFLCSLNDACVIFVKKVSVCCWHCYWSRKISSFGLLTCSYQGSMGYCFLRVNWKVLKAYKYLLNFLVINVEYLKEKRYVSLRK